VLSEKSTNLLVLIVDSKNLVEPTVRNEALEEGDPGYDENDPVDPIQRKFRGPRTEPPKC